MSYVMSPEQWELGEDPPYIEELAAIPDNAPAQFERSGLIPLAFLVPLIFSAIAYAAGGLQIFSDASFVSLTALCAVLLVIELFEFGERQGIGAILIYGGILVWFCHDYYSNWFMHDYHRLNPAFAGVTPDTIARALFYHCIFIEVVVIMFRFPIFRWADKLVVAVPEPSTPRFYLLLVIAMLLFGWTAFLFAEEPFFTALLQGACWWVFGPVQFTAHRSGNINYDWSGYLAQVIQVGQVGGILGAVYAILVARNIFLKIFGWFTWAFWMSFSLAGERRSEIAFMALPIIGILFIKFHDQAASRMKKRNIKGFVITGIVGACVWYGVQWETSVRIGGDDQVDVFRAMGNTMFSEGLRQWQIIPEPNGFAEVNFPGAGVIRPIPETIWWFLIGPIPRALWHGKPIDDFELNYSALISHDTRWRDTGGLSGTTVSNGAVGYWYFRYGPPGVVQGGLIYGWLFGVAERAIRRTHGRPMKLLFALSFATFLFRSYRDLWWHNLYPIMIGGVVITVIVKLFFSSPEPGQHQMLQQA